MFIGVLEIELFLPGSLSLKDKRQAIRSIKDKIRARYNASVAEVDFQDKWQRARLGISLVNTGQREAEDILEKIALLIGDNGECIITRKRMQIFVFDSDREV